METRRTRLSNAKNHPRAFAVFAAVTMLSGIFFTDPVHATEDTRVAALRTAETTRFQAQVDADAKVLDKLLDADLEYTHSNGDQDTKSSFIDSLTTGKRDYVSTVATPESVRIFGDVGVIRGTAKVTVAEHGRSIDLRIGYTDIWLWKEGRWQMTAWRSARLPDSPVK